MEEEDGDGDGGGAAAAASQPSKQHSMMFEESIPGPLVPPV